MSFLDAAVALIGVLCLANLALVLTVIRRVGRHGEHAAALPRPHMRLPSGTKAPAFTAMTVAGESRSLADLTGTRSLMGFFSPHCGPCRTQLPEFAELARTIPGGAAQVLAVVNAEEKEAAEFAAGLDGAASVVVESPSGPVATAFSVDSYPTFYLIGEDGRIQASAPAVRMLGAPAPA
jgi:peroxiredoxin